MKSASLQQIDSMMLILQAEFDDRLWDTRLESFSLHFVDSSTMDHQVEQTEGKSISFLHEFSVHQFSLA